MDEFKSKNKNEIIFLMYKPTYLFGSLLIFFIASFKKRLSSYEVQKRLIGFDKNVKNFLSKDIINGRKLELPKVSTFFHYKHKLFSELLAWDYKKIKDFLHFISTKRENIIFSSEINLKFNLFDNVSRMFCFLEISSSNVIWFVGSINM